jgi:hypothetical protein
LLRFARNDAVLASRGGAENAEKESPLSKADCSRYIDFILFVMKEQQQGIV